MQQPCQLLCRCSPRVRRQLSRPQAQGAGIGTLLGHEQRVRRDVLVTYVYSDSDEQYLGNMHFFVSAAVRASDPADYYLMLEVGRQPHPSRLLGAPGLGCCLPWLLLPACCYLLPAAAPF